MLFKELEHGWKLSVSGSMNRALRHICSDVVFEELFQEWYEDKFENVDGKVQYVKIKTDERLNVDAALLEDLKNVFKERFYKKIANVKVKDIKRVSRQKKEPATEKQIKYAKRLYGQIFGEVKNFDDREYTKYEMIKIIGDLKEKTYTSSSNEEYDFKVIEFKRT